MGNEVDEEVCYRLDSLRYKNLGLFNYTTKSTAILDFELIQDEIDIDSIEEYKQEHTERCIDIDIRNKINELVQVVKQLNKKLEEK